MKLKIKKSKCREVVYLGKAIAIPEKHQYVAADEDGEVFSYPEKPKQSAGTWYSKVYKRVKGVDMDFEGMLEDWEYSLFYFPLS